MVIKKLFEDEYIDINVQTSDERILFDFDDQDVPDYWPFKVINATFGDPHAYLQANIPGICEAINSLKDHEKEVVLMRFKDEMTLKAIGEYFNMTHERIRQILAKAMRKLRYPVRAKLMVGVTKAEWLEVKKNLAFAEGRILVLENDLEITKAHASGETPSMVNIFALKIDELELSVRAFNCIKRAGIDTVADLSQKTVCDLMKIRNLGRKSLDEVLQKLVSLGIILPEDE